MRYSEFVPATLATIFIMSRGRQMIDITWQQVTTLIVIFSFGICALFILFGLPILLAYKLDKKELENKKK